MSDVKSRLRERIRDEIFLASVSGGFTVADAIDELLTVFEELVFEAWVGQGGVRSDLETDIERVDKAMLRFLPKGFQANTGAIGISLIRGAAKTLKAKP